MLHEGIKLLLLKHFLEVLLILKKIVEWIKTFEDEKYYEILFHPGKYDPSCKSSLNKDRERDVEHIKKLNAILEENNIKVVSYLDLAATP